MTDIAERVARSTALTATIQTVWGRRSETARRRFQERIRSASDVATSDTGSLPETPLGWWHRWAEYTVDAMQRSILFWDTLRRRGNAFIEHERAGKPPMLHFDYETVLDARTFDRPVNYALLRITPPQGVTVDPQRRPYVVIDPRAGHGPGIGGFKNDSQVGVALRAGHPVYFVVFYPDPEPGQTLLDVCEAESRFICEVRRLHPDSPRPAIVGNCQGGWAAMMLAAANPDDTGPIVINGAPMSYWGGAWAEGEGDNPMRYAGGLLGGSWLASMVADLGGGKFDGAHLVQNFENLNPANTFWNKYYHLFANVDTEPPRFLEFERWWGGFFLMNREEIEWIVQNLFVGNKLWTDGNSQESGRAFDLRDIRSPIILFASMGDNITPPQQAFNWVADTYGSTEEIKARGQTIVGLVHQDIGHLGIFVSGRVAKKEHTQIVSVLQSIERLPAGLWAMQIHERKRDDGGVDYEVDFTERSLEDVVARLNRFERKDERAFEAAAAISEMNQRFYETFMRPWVQAATTEPAAEAMRWFHPLRFARWSMSDLNPATWWLGPAAEAVKADRRSAEADHPWRRWERFGSEMISASLDYYRDLRDAASEATFFQCYGPLALLAPSVTTGDDAAAVESGADPRQLPFVREALASIDQGGYAEAVARAAFLLQRQNEPLPVWRLHLRKELAEAYRELLPDLPPDEWRRLRGRQEIIARFEPTRSIATLPSLLADARDRQRFLTLLERLLADPRVQADDATPQQRMMLAQIVESLGETAKERGPRSKTGRANRQTETVGG